MRTLKSEETYRLLTNKLQKAYDSRFAINYNVFIAEILLFIARLLMDMQKPEVV